MTYGKASFDAVVTDVVMPGGMTGYAAADAARSIRPDVKVMFMTGYGAPPASQGVHAGAPMLRKPFRKQELAEAVRAALEAP